MSLDIAERSSPLSRNSAGAPSGPLAVCVPRIGPYHAARLRAAATRGDLVVVETRRTDGEYAWDEVRDLDGIPRRTLLSGSEGELASTAGIRQQMLETLDEVRPRGIAVTGWSEPDALAALEWSLGRGVPAIMMSESQERDASRSWLKERLKQAILGASSAALVGGAPHANYIARLGMPPGRIVPGYDVVDNDWFAQGADAARRHAPELRAALGLPEKFFLASNRFIEKKNLERLLEAFARYRAAAGTGGWHLVLLGSGPLEARLRTRVAELSLVPSVHFAGFQQYEALPQFYGLASAFVHASTTEQWGLVVNEAMAAGLPVLVSKACGCAADLVQKGRNGYRFDPLDVAEIAEMLRIVADDRERCLEMGQESRRIIADWSPTLFGENLWKAMELAAGAPPRSTLLSRLALCLMSFRSRSA